MHKKCGMETRPRSRGGRKCHRPAGRPPSRCVPLTGREADVRSASRFGLEEVKTHLRTDVRCSSPRFGRLVVPAAPPLLTRTFNHWR